MYHLFSYLISELSSSVVFIRVYSYVHSTTSDTFESKVVKVSAFQFNDWRLINAIQTDKGKHIFHFFYIIATKFISLIKILWLIFFSPYVASLSSLRSDLKLDKTSFSSLLISVPLQIDTKCFISSWDNIVECTQNVADHHYACFASSRFCKQRRERESST